MRQYNPARSFRSLLTWLVLLAAAALVLLTAFNPVSWLREGRFTLPIGIHSPLYADYSADLRGMFAPPADLRLLEEALAARQVDANRVINDLLTPVPTITLPAGAILPTLPVSSATATLAPGITATLTWTPTPTLTLSIEWTATSTRTPRATQPGSATRTPGPDDTQEPAPATATREPTFTNTPQPTPTHTPDPTPTRTPTRSGYPPPVTPTATPPAYP